MNTTSVGVDPRITAAAAIAAALLSLIGVGLTIYFNNAIAKKNVALQKDLADQNHTIAKKNEIRKEIAFYLSELTKINQILTKFFESRRELVEEQNFLAQLIDSGANPEVTGGHNPRIGIAQKNEELRQCKEEWDSGLKLIEQKSQELLLFFKSQEDDGIDKLLLYCPQRLKELNWIFTSNMPINYLGTFVDNIDIEQNIYDIRTEMRDFLN